MSNRMEIENPYQPPRGDGQEEIATHKKPERPVYNTRWQATRAGIQRGAIKGLKVSAILSGCLIVAILLFAIIVIVGRARMIYAFPGVLLSLVKQFIEVLASSLGCCIFFTIGCASLGAIIMGLIETIRFRKPK